MILPTIKDFQLRRRLLRLLAAGLVLGTIIFFGTKGGAQEVEPLSGELVGSEVDLTLPAGPLNLEVSRFYSADRTFAGLLGKRWVCNWEVLLVKGKDGILIRSGSGETLFEPTRSSGEYRNLSGERLDLRKNGEAVLTAADRSKSIFDVRGRLIGVEDRNGNRIQLKYDGAGRPRRVEGPRGSSLDFTLNAEGRLTVVSASS